MRIKSPVEQEIRRAIRNARAKDPLITVVGLQDALERHFQREFSRAYLAKMNDKVARETRMEIDRAQIEPRLASLRENYRLMREELLKIVYWTPEDVQPGVPKPLAKDRVEAAKAVVQLDLAILSAEMAAGLYKKPIEEIAKTFQYEPLPPETRMVIIAAWQRGGLLPKQAIEELVPRLADQAG